MTHSILDVSGFDHDNDGIVSRIYFGDLGGNIFALKDDELQTFTPCTNPITRSVVDGTWTARKLFTASCGSVQRKIFYAPDAVEESYGEIIYFGTGDRENPDDTTVVNRFYAVKNDWTGTSTLTESDLVDVTSNLIQLGTTEQRTQVKAQLESGKGWFIRLENPGEKVVATPRVYAGVVYLTTYTPSDGSGTTSGDPCAASTARGVARLYAMDYKTGGGGPLLQQRGRDRRFRQLGQRWERRTARSPSEPRSRLRPSLPFSAAARGFSSGSRAGW